MWLDYRESLDSQGLDNKQDTGHRTYLTILHLCRSDRGSHTLSSGIATSVTHLIG
jgi:hypothetical protein